MGLRPPGNTNFARVIVVGNRASPGETTPVPKSVEHLLGGMTLLARNLRILIKPPIDG
ncbi:MULTISPECIES: hypothetical protein [unclassified Rhizobium]|uniref:hypothetical protein n=1 Tax=unclassified Rhizobium TaxID=2613769 RepID=UPI00129AC25F|nr:MULTISPECIES: hypothetical protein [unclassified Rhizobium]